MRGRVGRSNKKAFCYLLAPPLSSLTPEARRRLQAIENFSDLGSGIHIAMQDLDIRGAGNMLGAEQSGFIADLGYEIMATGGTAEYLKEKGVKVTVATKVSEGSPNILDDIKEGRISMVINTTNHGRDAERDGFKIRRSTVEHAIACLTSMDTARELQHVMSAMRRRRVVCSRHRYRRLSYAR